MRRYRGRGMHPTTAARIARQRERDARQAEDRAALARIIATFDRVEVTNPDEARAAWALPSLRSLVTHYDTGGTAIATIVRGVDGAWFIQEASFPGWKFSRLVIRDDHDAHVRARALARAPSLASFSLAMGAALLPKRGAK